MPQLDASILREFVEQIRGSDTYTTDEQQKRVKIREIEISIISLACLILRKRRSNPKLLKTKIMRKSAQLDAAPTLA